MLGFDIPNKTTLSAWFLNCHYSDYNGDGDNYGDDDVDGDGNDYNHGDDHNDVDSGDNDDDDEDIGDRDG